MSEPKGVAYMFRVVQVIRLKASAKMYGSGQLNGDYFASANEIGLKIPQAAFKFKVGSNL